MNGLRKFFARMRGHGNAAQGCTFTPSFNAMMYFMADLIISLTYEVLLTLTNIVPYLKKYQQKSKLK